MRVDYSTYFFTVYVVYHSGSSIFMFVFSCSVKEHQVLLQKKSVNCIANFQLYVDKITCNEWIDCSLKITKIDSLNKSGSTRLTEKWRIFPIQFYIDIKLASLFQQFNVLIQICNYSTLAKERGEKCGKENSSRRRKRSKGLSS